MIMWSNSKKQKLYDILILTVSMGWIITSVSFKWVDH